MGVIPVTGDWASSMMAESQQRGVEVHTWTPSLRSGETRSRVEADYTIFGVRWGIADAERASGRCKPEGIILIACRGMLGTNRGQPPCETRDDY